MTQEDTQQEKEKERSGRRVGGRMRYSAHATHLIAGAGMGQGATCVPGKTVWRWGEEEYFIQGVAVVDYDSIMIMLHALATNVIAALSDFNSSRN